MVDLVSPTNVNVELHPDDYPQEDDSFPPAPPTSEPELHQVATQSQGANPMQTSRDELQLSPLGSAPPTQPSQASSSQDIPSTVAENDGHDASESNASSSVVASPQASNPDAAEGRQQVNLSLLSGFQLPLNTHAATPISSALTGTAAPHPPTDFNRARLSSGSGSGFLLSCAGGQSDPPQPSLNPAPPSNLPPSAPSTPFLNLDIEEVLPVTAARRQWPANFAALERIEDPDLLGYSLGTSPPQGRYPT
jgi:hypothetical protein